MIPTSGEKIVVTTSPQLEAMVRTTDVGKRFKDAGLRVLFLESFTPPFSFDSAQVVAVVASNKGNDLFDAREMDLFPSCKVITPFGIGTDHINLAEAKHRGIPVTCVPKVMRKSVAELVIGLIISLAHRISEADALMKRGVWDRLVGSTLEGKTLGIVGLGNIGKEVAKRAFPFDMRILAHDIVYDEYFLREHPYVIQVSRDELFETSDIITFHVPLTVETKYMVKAESIAQMKDGVCIVNTARGLIVDERALLDALKKKKVGGAALETFSKEPPFGNVVLEELILLSNVITTPHLATFTPEVRYAVANRVLHNISVVLDGRIHDADIV